MLAAVSVTLSEHFIGIAWMRFENCYPHNLSQCQVLLGCFTPR